MMLYFHIPFCSGKCAYCSFYSVGGVGRVADFVDALCAEITSSGGGYKGVSSLYFGGGTPSVLGLDDFRRILNCTAQAYDLSGVREFTVEANPDHLTRDFLEGLREIGVNRLSIGVQSLNDQRLRQIGRRHTAGQALKAISLAREVGFTNISADLIFGFEDLGIKEWQASIDGLLGSGVQHISAYQLSIESGSRFARQGTQCASDEVCVAQFNALRKSLTTSGFEQYEISNFAKPGHQAQHNGGYWTGREYRGFGPSAHSYDGKNRRSWNISDLDKYIAGAPPQCEILTPQDLHNEFLMTRLRTAAGFSLGEYAEKFGRQFIDNVQDSNLVMEDGWVRIPPEKFFIADSIISDYFVV